MNTSQQPITGLIEATRAQGRIVTFDMETRLKAPFLSVEGAKAILAEAALNPHQPLSAGDRERVVARLDVIRAASWGRSKTDEEQAEFDDLCNQLDARAETSPKLPTLAKPPAAATGQMPVALAVSFAKACLQADVPEIMATVMLECSSIDEAQTRIDAAQQAKKIIHFPPGGRDQHARTA